MTKSKAEKIETASQSPLDALHLHLKDDMVATNKLIIERLDSDVNVIPQVASYIISAGGKRIRPLLTLACADLLDAHMLKSRLLASAVEFIHTATLLHDDVVDDSDQRRGQTASHLVFGNETAVLVGDFLFARAFELMVETDSLEALEILSKASAIITEGEVKQLTTARNFKTSIQDYFKVIEGKTAALFSAACEVSAHISDDHKDAAQHLKEYGYHLGMAFQISDDVLDYSANQQKLGKDVGDDFREGKMTLPIILAIQEANEEEGNFWSRVISTPSETKAEDFPNAQNLLVKHSIYDKAIKIAEEHCDQASKALDNLPDKPIRDVLRDLLAYCVKRLY